MNKDALHKKIDKDYLLKKFIERWEKKIAKIEKIELSPDQAQKINFAYIHETNSLFIRQRLSDLKEESEPSYDLLLYQYTELLVDLNLALFQAINNYEKSFPSIINRLRGFKIKDFEFSLEGLTKK